jgi:RNA polymerase subunit RPABC4/transcription elongation factor Spt4
MGDLLNQITSFLGGIWDSSIVQLGLRAIAIYVVILWLAAAYWAFRDMQLRTANPILPYFAASLVIIFTPIFFPFAVVAYRIVRPQEKIGEVYERTLAEEALLAEVEAVKSCPTCARRVNEDWIICPTCRTRLNRVCPNCSRLVGLDWSLCAWCGRDFERAVPGFEAIPAPRHAPVAPSEGMFAARPTPAPALDAATYRKPAAPGSSSFRAGPPADIARTATRDGAHRDAPPVTPPAPPPPPPQLTPPPVPPPLREPTPPSLAGGSSALTSTYEPTPGPSRSLDRAPQPPTATRSALPAAPARPARPAPQRALGKGQTKGPRPSSDPLPEH